MSATDLVLLPGQQDYLLTEGTGEQGAVALYGFSLSFPNSVDVAHLANALRDIVAQCSSFRSTIQITPDGIGYQRIHSYDEDQLNLELVDASEMDSEEAQRLFDSYHHHDSLNWNDNAVYRFRIFRLSRGRHCLAVSLRNIAFDAASIEMLGVDIVQSVQCRSERRFHEINDDLVESVNKLELPKSDIERHLEHWSNIIGTLPAFSEININRSGVLSHVDRTTDQALLNAPASSIRVVSNIIKILDKHSFTEQPPFVDCLFSLRSKLPTRQYGMFSLMRPIRVGGDTPRALMRAMTYQRIPSNLLRDMEYSTALRDHAIPQINYIRRDSYESIGLPKGVGYSVFSPKRKSVRPLQIRVVARPSQTIMTLRTNNEWHDDHVAGPLLDRVMSAIKNQ